MKFLKNQAKFFVTTFLVGIASLLADPLPLAQAQIGASATDMRAIPAAIKQQATPAPPAAEKIVSTASDAVLTVTYLELLKIQSSTFDGDRQTYGKTVQIAVNGKGDLGYFLKKSDAITFVCDSGDKTLTTNRTFKGTIQGVVYKSTGWEGATIYSMNKCQIVK